MSIHSARGLRDFRKMGASGRVSVGTQV